MDHDETLEALELAAVEPGGLDRLMAGDTPQAAAIAGHLAGCEACPDELERLHRAVPLLRDVVRTSPPADLRTRTLAFVEERGVERGAVPPVPATPVPATPTATLVPLRASRQVALPWMAAIAAAVIVSVVATSFIVGGRIDAQVANQQRAIAGLQRVTAATLEITNDVGAGRVALTATDGSAVSGSLLFSPGTTRLVVVATGLKEPPDGREYRCWVLVDGVRQPVGRMFFAGDLAFWVGDTPAVATLPSGATFGVSLAEVGGTSLDADPALIGEF